MKIRKFIEFIKEEFTDTPEEYVSTSLSQLKIKFEKMFDFQEDAGEEPKERDQEKSIRRAKEESKGNDNMSLKDLGVRLESSEISKYSNNDSYTIKFSDDNATYTLILTIDLKEAIPKADQENFSYKDIKKCYIKFKKYDIDNFDIIGQISKNIEIDDIDEEFLINLKIELDDTFGDENEDDFEIETE